MINNLSLDEQTVLEFLYTCYQESKEFVIFFNKEKYDQIPNKSKEEVNKILSKLQILNYINISKDINKYPHLFAGDITLKEKTFNYFN